MNACLRGIDMSEIVFVIEEDELDGGYIARALGHGITTQAETIPELKLMIADALRCHFDSDADIPKIIRLHYIKDEVLALV